MPWIEPITDWDGVTEVPNRKWYNFDDLNRVEKNIAEIESLINSFSTIDPLTTVTDRDMTRIEFYDSLNRIESNILALKNATHQPLEWETPKTNWVSVYDQFDYVDANRLEKNLKELYNLANRIKDYLQHCGTFYCGQNNSYL